MKPPANLTQYKVIHLNRVKIPESLIGDLSLATTLCTVLWLVYSLFAGTALALTQLVVGFFTYSLATAWSSTSSRIRIELKAKGLLIKTYSEDRLIPWAWLTTVEIRYRGWNIFPNYVCFNFRDRRDCLVLLDDVLKDMDITTLMECIRTWAPGAEIQGDVWLARSESIATYTELWLKDSNRHETRLRVGQTQEQGTLLNGEYKILKMLNSGGQGTAYLASPEAPELKHLPPEVVLKEFILPENDRGSRNVQESLFKEATLLKRIDHPLITRFFDCFIDDLRGYLVIEYSPGVTLKDLVLNDGPPSESLVKSISVQLCEALGYLHSLEPPIIHGDVAPDNVILAPDGKIKLLDFAAAQELSRSRTSTVIGKHSYMAPEQFKGMADARSDLYSLGCTMYFLLTGAEPEPLTELHPKDLAPSVSDSMDKIVFSATQFNATTRTADTSIMKAQLQEV